jgi:hypothetical protein
VVNIQTRKLTPTLASLVKQLDAMVDNVADKQGNDSQHAFLVLLTDDPDAAAKELESFAAEHQIENIPLTLFDGETGPPGYNIAQDAEVTVMMWKDQKVAVNHAYAADQLNAAALQKVLADAREHLN